MNRKIQRLNTLLLAFVLTIQTFQVAESFCRSTAITITITTTAQSSPSTIQTNNHPLNYANISPQRIATSALSLDPKSLLYAEQEKLLVKRGKYEGELLAKSQYQPVPLEPNVVKGASGGGGFGGSGGSGGGGGSAKKNLLKTQAKAHAKVLKEQGVVRIDNVLSKDLADTIRERVYQMRQESEELVQSGSLPSLARFADVLLKENRCDMTIPLGTTCDDKVEEWVAQALASVLVDSPVGGTYQNLLGKDAILREWSCLMSDPSSQRQVMHPDTPYQEEPVLYTCFIALQDIDLDMGPTTWMPETHVSQEIHDQFQDDTKSSGNNDLLSPKDELLMSKPTVLGTISKGCCAIFDSRLLHAGGANTSTTSRALLYCTFQNPKVTNVGNPGSIRNNLIGQWTLQKLQKELTKYQKGKPSEVYV